MSGVRIPLLRAAMFIALGIVALLGFAAAEIAFVGSTADGEVPYPAVAVNAEPDTLRFAGPIPGPQAEEMLQTPASQYREQGAWLLMVFGLGAVAFALRCRRSEPAHQQFV